MFYHYFVALLLVYQILVHLHVGRCPQYESNDESDAHLTYNLVTALESFLVVAEYLDEVVHTAKESQPYGCDNHQKQIYVAQTSEQQYRDEYRYDDDDAAHRRYADFLYSERIDRGVALRLCDLLLLKKLYEFLAEPCRYYKRQDERQQRTERYISPHMGTANAIFLEKSEKIV